MDNDKISVHSKAVTVYKLRNSRQINDLNLTQKRPFSDMCLLYRDISPTRNHAKNIYSGYNRYFN